MKAIVQNTYGSADVLEYKDVDQPVAGDDQLLIRVYAAGLDAGVWHLMTGRPYAIRAFGFGLRRPKTEIRGLEVAGIVETAGANVTGFQPGDEVFGTCDGAFAEYTCARPDKVAVKPAELTFEQAAAVPISAVTALQALRDVGRVRPAQTVLIIGAAGGVGTFAVQLAKAFGADVTGVCSTEKTDLVRSIGADHVIDYTREDFADGSRRFDLIVDTAGNRPLSHLRRALDPQGTAVLVGGEGGGRLLGGAVTRQLRAFVVSPFVSQKLRGLFSVQRDEDLRFLANLIESGKVTPVIDRSYPLGEVPEAIRHQQEHHARGKIVIAVQSITED